MTIYSKRARQSQQDVEPVDVQPTPAEELIKCRDSVQYFFENYVQIPTFGDEWRSPRRMLNSQARLFSSLQEFQHTIFLKDRAVGFSTAMMAYLLWETIFNTGKSVIVVSPNHRMSEHSRRQLDDIFHPLPEWLKPAIRQQNQNRISFENGSSIVFKEPTKDFGHGLSASHIVFDEMAFNVRLDLDCAWHSLTPYMGRGTKFTLASTKGGGKLFNDLWADAWGSRQAGKAYRFEPRILFKE